jgi:hypothetical protein
MKETYPIPTAGKKPPARNVIRPAATKDNPLPNESLTGTREQWEEAVFRHAAYFTVVRRLPRKVKIAPVEFDRHEYKTFPEALSDAGDDPQALVYAVFVEEGVPGGRHFCIPRGEWEKYVQIWEEGTCLHNNK